MLEDGEEHARLGKLPKAGSQFDREEDAHCSGFGAQFLNCCLGKETPKQLLDLPLIILILIARLSKFELMGFCGN
jgi:hypothetical protein